MPKVSIITPIYCDTSAKVDWLGEAIDSVLKQTLTDWEMILINDKSPISLGAVRSLYDDERLRWLENSDNFGTAKTRNMAVALAESDCILPLDSDDLLGDEETLEAMYDAWIMDKTRIIYGNVQLLTPLTPTTFKLGKVIQLASYSFENAMDLRGTLPVTCMHSIACHQNALAEIEPDQFVYGWKSILHHGREDVEYWIAAGKRGYCGLKINHTTLVYRKHEHSRDYRLKANNQLDLMQAKIKGLHRDVYSGRFPMACCGGKGGKVSAASAPDPIVMSQAAQAEEIRFITTLDDYDENDLEWIAYQGPKQGSFGSILTRSPAHLPQEYRIMGTGHYFQIHKRHKPLFEQRQHIGFRINVPDPRDRPEPEPAQPQIIPEPEPIIPENVQSDLSVIERLDRIAAQTRQAEIQVRQEPAMPKFEDEVIIEPNPQPSYSATMTPHASDELYELGLGPSLTNILVEEHFTVEFLANTTPQRLISLPGIGIKWANTIIERAQELISKR